MNTTAAATEAGVTTTTIRTWCRHNVIAAIKVAGRWIIDAASLAYRIALGKERRMDDITPLTRAQFEAAARELGIRTTFKDARCLGEWKAYERTEQHYDDTPYDRLMVARGKAVEREGYAPILPDTRTAGPQDLAGREMTALTGLVSPARGNDCHYCGLDRRTCDCH